MRRPVGVAITGLVVTACAALHPEAQPLPSPSDPSTPAVAAFDPGQAGTVLALHRITAEEGWALTARYLLWTADGGQSWSSITPTSTSDTVTLRAAFFLDTKRGWAVSSNRTDRGHAVLSVFRTADGGRTWKTSRMPAPAFSPEPIPFEGVGGFHFVDPKHGWMRLFTHEVIYDPPIVPTLRTVDGGGTWEDFPDTSSGPIRSWGPFQFTSPTEGWRRDGQRLEVTRNGGGTWSPVDLPVPPAYRATQSLLGLPTFFNGRDGVLAATYSWDTSAAVVFYTTHDAGATWKALSPLTDPNPHPRGQDYGLPTFFIEKTWTVLFRDSLAMSHDLGQTWTAIRLAGARRLWLVDFVTPARGWGLSVDGAVQTGDGGLTWQPLALARQK